MDDVLNNWESQALFESLRELRLKIAGEQSVPPYAIFPDKTLLEFVRYRPQDIESIGLMTGVGEVKLDRFGAPFLEGLQAHEEEHGRPENLPEIPADRAAKRERKKEKVEEFTSTAQKSLELFLELGDVDAVSEERKLKPRTIWNHLVLAANFGKIDYRTLIDITDDEVELIKRTCDELRANGIIALTPIFEKLEEKYPFEVIRLIRACAK